MAKNSLNRTRARALEDYLESIKSDIGNRSLADVAKVASKVLNFEVTGNNIKGACKVMGIALPRRRTTHLNPAIRLLAREIIRVQGELGIVVVPQLRVLAEDTTDA